MKISLLLLLCFASFLFNFNSRKDALKYNKKNSMKFQEFKNDNNEIDDKIINEEIDKLAEKSKKMVTDENGEKLIDENSETDCNKISQIGLAYEKVSKTYLYKYKVFNPYEMIVKFTDFVDDNKEILKDSFDLVSDVKYCIQKKGKLNTRCARFQYSGFRNILMQQIRIYATNKCPSILNMIGYSIRKKKQYLFVENKGNGTLRSFINNPKHFKINQTQKLIIAYGVASALESLHKNNIIHRNVNLSNISLDKDLHPYLSNFYFAVQIDTKLPYVVTETTPEFMSPEFIQDSKSNQLSFKLDVYSYGIVLFMLITENNPFKGLSKKKIFSNALKGKRPNISHTVNKEWKELIIQCWDQNPTNRPTFITNICECKIIQ